MRIFLLSNRPELSSVTRPYIQHYADKFGHTVHAYDKSLCTTRHPSWSKLILLKEVQDGEYAAWIDDDAIITNFTSDKLSDFAKELGSAALLASADRCGGSPLNGGVLLVHGGLNLQCLIDCTWDLTCSDPNFAWGGWWEQSALAVLYKDCPSLFKIVPHGTLQSSYCNWTPESFILHLSVTSMKDRLEILAKVKDSICYM